MSIADMVQNMIDELNEAMADAVKSDNGNDQAMTWRRMIASQGVERSCAVPPAIHLLLQIWYNFEQHYLSMSLANIQSTLQPMSIADMVQNMIDELNGRMSQIGAEVQNMIDELNEAMRRMRPGPTMGTMRP